MGICLAGRRGRRTNGKTEKNVYEIKLENGKKYIIKIAPEESCSLEKSSALGTCSKVDYYLTAHNLVMSGKELQGIFNNNDILTTYRTPFGEKGERGIYTVIRNAWKYYQYTKHDYQTAYAIARSFVNKNGEYAYNT